MRNYLRDACETVDASIFSGDVLYSRAEREELKEYVERWLRAINSHEDGEPCEVCFSTECNGECMGDGLLGG